MRAVFAASRSAVMALGRGSSSPGWTIVVVALSIAAWVSMLVLAAGMDQGPGTPPHNLPMFLVGWVIMLTAMMLPSELNYIGAFSVLLRGVATLPSNGSGECTPSSRATASSGSLTD